jgi:hypothetical protein
MARNGKLMEKIKATIVDEILDTKHGVDFYDIANRLWDLLEIDVDEGLLTEALGQLKNEGVAVEDAGGDYYLATPEDLGGGE